MTATPRFKGLGHVNVLHRPGDHDIAVELTEALGCTISDTGGKGDTGDAMLAVHPDPDDPIIQYNVFYMSEIAPEHLAVETALQQESEENPGLRQGLTSYREKVRSRPFGLPHFALRYRSTSEVEAVAERLSHASEKLKERIHVRIFRPEDPDAVSKIIQGFVYQDVIVAGSFLLGQLIELQAPDTRS